MIMIKATMTTTTMTVIIMMIMLMMAYDDNGDKNVVGDVGDEKIRNDHMVDVLQNIKHV